MEDECELRFGKFYGQCGYITHYVYTHSKIQDRTKIKTVFIEITVQYVLYQYQESYKASFTV